MNIKTFWEVIIFVLLLILCTKSSPAEFNLPILAWEDGTNGITSSSQFVAIQAISAISLSAEDINNNPLILPNTKLTLEYTFHFLSPSVAIQTMIDYSDNDRTFVAGNPLSDISVLTGIVGDVYDIAQLSATATSSSLSDKNIYPYYSRISSPSSAQSFAIIDMLLHFESIQGRGWTDVALISTTDEYGVNLSANFIDNIQNSVTIGTYQQFLPGATDIEIELNEVKKSKARVIIAFLFTGFDILIEKASEMGLTGDQYVWIVPDSIVGIPFTTNATSVANQESQGLLGTFIFIPSTNPETIDFTLRWASLDPLIYPGAGPNTPPTPFAYLAYDMLTASALVIDEIDKMGLLDSGERIPAQTWTDVIKNLKFNGTSGEVKIDENGDRIASFFILNYFPNNLTWSPVGVWSPFEGYNPIPDVDIIWYSNTTEIPDLDVRPAFDYWSCHDKKEKHDSTGKEIDLETPDGSNINNIDSTYHCDQYIDCKNMSDESVDCSQNYTVLFIVFGILTGLLILFAIFLLIFVCIFGMILKYRRLRVASPPFLILMLLSIVIGYISTYAWYGKPHPVACAFQPWLLGLSSISMIVALGVKSFRIWRIFRFPLHKTKITNYELLILWILIMIPVVFILVIWTAISTPTAAIHERNGEDHYVCETGGVTGPPGGLVFFFILVTYSALVLLSGAFLSIVTRKVPSQFNESKLLAISIYNLVFLAIVVIPVFLVLQPFNPFLAWIIRTLAILYAFTATMILQFLPKLIGIVIMDKCKNNIKQKQTISSSSMSISSTRSRSSRNNNNSNNSLN